MEVPALEATGISFFEPRMDIVRSMERLYAVPSEKLRVWSIWLAKIGEMAGDWQKWLHSHIEVTINLGNRLREVQSISTDGEEPKDISAEVVSGESFSTAEETWKSAEEFEADKEKLKTSGEVDPGEVSADQERNNDEEVEKNGEMNDEETFEELTAVEGGEVSEAEAAAAIESLTNPEETASPEDATGIADNLELSTQSEIPREDKVDNDEEDEALMLQLLEAGMAWPIGRPWRPLPQSTETKKEMEAVESISVPSDEEEMLEFVKNFTRQATIYRSYYKHWRETGDQAVKEITGRSVMSTARVQGKYDVGISQGIDLKAASYPYEDVQTTNALTEPGAEIVEPIVETDTDPPSDVEPVGTTEEPLTSTEEPSEEQSPESGAPDNPAVDAASEIDLSRHSKTKAISTNISKNDDDPEKKRIAEYEGMERSIRDEARADEDIPYFFYLRAEADIEIAIEHNDEEVIPADPDRERIFANYRHLHFNLTDKPGKGGKPWL